MVKIRGGNVITMKKMLPILAKQEKVPSTTDTAAKTPHIGVRGT